ncbi:hypothetical protein DID78_02925 [Candidatus Marinamargulisbacteria bacterium SCGC AG-343-D04]|nr:hypothetical protein DID78_02925 [Candidatus Marinamargulisbacteria bacterium SCGC AG-343-D04]
MSLYRLCPCFGVRNPGAVLNTDTVSTTSKNSVESVVLVAPASSAAPPYSVDAEYDEYGPSVSPGLGPDSVVYLVGYPEGVLFGSLSQVQQAQFLRKSVPSPEYAVAAGSPGSTSSDGAYFPLGIEGHYSSGSESSYASLDKAPLEDCAEGETVTVHPLNLSSVSPAEAGKDAAKDWAAREAANCQYEDV